MPRKQGYNWRGIVLAIFVISAVITPPDPFSMLLMAGPTLLLYLLGLVLTSRGKRHEVPIDPPAAAAT